MYKMVDTDSWMQKSNSTFAKRRNVTGCEIALLLLAKRNWNTVSNTEQQISDALYKELSYFASTTTFLFE